MKSLVGTKWKCDLEGGGFYTSFEFNKGSKMVITAANGFQTSTHQWTETKSDGCFTIMWNSETTTPNVNTLYVFFGKITPDPNEKNKLKGTGLMVNQDTRSIEGFTLSKL
jgi:hypothetical protein